MNMLAFTAHVPDDPTHGWESHGRDGTRDPMELCRETEDGHPHTLHSWKMQSSRMERRTYKSGAHSHTPPSLPWKEGTSRHPQSTTSGARLMAPGRSSRPNGIHLLLLLASTSILISDGLELAGGGDALHREILRDETLLRLEELGKISDGQGFLERTFLSPASIRATHVIISWMKDAGLTTWIDQMGNIHGRFEPPNSTDKALLIGSHMDTVIDAGMYDGALGIICAISAMKVLKVTGKLERLTRPVEVIAFSDEEGVRFQTTFLGSAAVAGILPESILQVSDKSGTTVEEVLKLNSFEATAGALGQVKYSPGSVGSYVEVHLEQGPVLEALHYPLGVVQGIAGQTRLKVIVDGSQGHAGTVPMKLRRDPMVAAAELVVTLESLCKAPRRFLTLDEECGCFTEESLGGLVCTVGELLTWPSASNVIPGQVNFTVDIRAMDDTVRETIVASFSRIVMQRCDDRLVDCAVEHKHSAPATPCDPELTTQLELATRSAVSASGRHKRVESTTTPVLMSGAGHDAMAMARLTKVGMVFVRCRGGVSHSPEEHVAEDDVWAAGLALLRFVGQSVLAAEL